MIVYDLQCRAGGETFEAWFASSADYEDQCDRGLIACPYCGANEVVKAPMAPRLPAKENSRSPRQLLAKAQAEMLEKSRWVGDEFATHARAIHAGEAAPEPLHGRASLADAKSLVEEGVPVAPLPFPVVPPGELN